MHGTPELIVTDCGSAYKSIEFRAACHDLQITVERAPAGTPWMRPYVERLFRSIGTDLMARLTGRTFGNVLERGDADVQIPPPDGRLRRLVFGLRTSRKPQIGGVTVMGVTYQNRDLAAWRARNRSRSNSGPDGPASRRLICDSGASRRRPGRLWPNGFAPLDTAALGQQGFGYMRP